MEEIELKQGCTYIIKGIVPENENLISKCKILEVTETTYLLNDLDEDEKFRVSKDVYLEVFKAIELIEDFEVIFNPDIENKNIIDCGKSNPVKDINGKPVDVFNVSREYFELSDTEKIIVLNLLMKWVNKQLDSFVICLN
jgi:hypothetical protein